MLAVYLVERAVAPAVERPPPHQPIFGRRILEHRVRDRLEAVLRTDCLSQCDGSTSVLLHPRQLIRARDSEVTQPPRVLRDCCDSIHQRWLTERHGQVHAPHQGPPDIRSLLRNGQEIPGHAGNAFTVGASKLPILDHEVHGVQQHELLQAQVARRLGEWRIDICIENVGHGCVAERSQRLVRIVSCIHRVDENRNRSIVLQSDYRIEQRQSKLALTLGILGFAIIPTGEVLLVGQIECRDQFNPYALV